MQISEVKSPQDEKEFIDFPKRLYKNDPYWVCQLDSELRAIFDPDRNYLFRRGDATRWILKGPDGKTTGRIAAFLDRQKSSAGRQSDRRYRFF